MRTKKILKYFLLYTIFLILVVLVPGCKKKSFELFKSDYSDYLPVVKTVSVSPYSNDTTLVVIELVSEGDKPIELAGVCYGVNPNPVITDNYVICTQSGIGKYTLKISSLYISEVIYIRGFASNEYGYVYGNTMKYTVVAPSAPTVPCSLTNDQINFGGWQFNMSNVQCYQTTLYDAQYEVYSSCSSFAEMDLYFRQQPSNGIYTVNNTNFTGNDFNVMGSVNDGGTLFWMNDGYKIYVVDSMGYYSISMCNVGTSSTDGMNAQLYGKITYH